MLHIQTVVTVTALRIQLQITSIFYLMKKGLLFKNGYTSQVRAGLCLAYNDTLSSNFSPSNAA